MSAGTRRTNERCAWRDRALRRLRDAHRAEYDALFDSERAIEGLGQSAIWRARGTALRTLRDRYRAEYDVLYRVESGVELRACAVCRTPFWDALSPNQCGAPFCSRAWVLFRYLIDDEYRDRHQRTTARWILEHEVDDRQRRWARRVLDGVCDSHGRWLIEGSETYDVALDCVRFGLPIVERFPADVLEQLEAALVGAA